MKKICTLLCAFIAGTSAFAQTFPNAGMDTWRSNTTGATHPVTIYAPTQWYGFDSLAISLIEFAGSLHLIAGVGTNYHAQLYQENTIKHSGSSSAKLMTLKQDTIGLVPGSLANATALVNIFAVASGTSLANATTFIGGTAVTSRITNVSAWVEYLSGIDSATGLWGTTDTALLTVQALGHKHGKNDTLVGKGVVQILPSASASFSQVTANILYFDTVDYYIDTIRVIFSSSGGGMSRPCDSSTLYVDDVSMTGVPNPDFTGVHNVTIDNSVRVYPNPAKDVLYIETTQPEEAEFTLYSVTGKAVANKSVLGRDMLDVSALPAGIYFYVLHDGSGQVIKNGKVTLNR